jgi:hypothetical protein
LPAELQAGAAACARTAADGTFAVGGAARSRLLVRTSSGAGIEFAVDGAGELPRAVVVPGAVDLGEAPELRVRAPANAPMFVRVRPFAAEAAAVAAGGEFVHRFDQPMVADLAVRVRQPGAEWGDRTFHRDVVLAGAWTLPLAW